MLLEITTDKVTIKILNKSDIKSKMHNISVMNNIFLTFNCNFSVITACCLGFIPHKILQLYDLCFYKTFLKIRMDNARGGGSFPAFFDGPCPDFLNPCSKIGDQIK